MQRSLLFLCRTVVIEFIASCCRYVLYTYTIYPVESCMFHGEEKKTKIEMKENGQKENDENLFK